MNQQNKTYKVLGIMSGTSMDGIDFCLAEFKKLNNEWTYSIIATDTFRYSSDWEKLLRNIESKSAVELVELDFAYGKYLGELVLKFLSIKKEKADFIASHGHTIFHQIDKGFTYQLGHGAAIAAKSNLICISDFRSLDVALGGQGAPLVPFGDAMLFQKFDACINLGGIANLSFQENNSRLAMDVCACNMVLNHITKKFFNKEFDEDGIISSSGTKNTDLFNSLNLLDFFDISGPKSLGKEWVFQTVIPLLEQSGINAADQLRTFSSHIAFQIASILKKNGKSTNLLLTGGGSRNLFLMELLKAEGLKFQLPSSNLIDYKEALIFGFLGLHRFLNKVNTYKSVTGASRDSCGGNVFLP